MEDVRRILNLVEEGKIDSAQAEKLIDAMGARKSEPTSPAQTPRFLCVKVTPKAAGGEKVNVRVPLKVVKAGMKLGALMPDKVKNQTQEALNKKGLSFDLNDLSSDNIEEFLQALGDLSVDVESEKENVQIYCQ